MSFNRVLADGWISQRGMSSRWKIPNEVLFLRVGEIHDQVFEGFREARFDGKCLFRVSNAHSERRAHVREDVSH